MLREVGRKSEQVADAFAMALSSRRQIMQRAERIRSLRPKDRNTSGHARGSTPLSTGSDKGRVRSPELGAA